MNYFGVQKSNVLPTYDDAVAAPPANGFKARSHMAVPNAKATNAFAPAPQAPAPAPVQSGPSPFAMPAPKPMSPIANAFKGFAAGLMGPERTQQIDDRHKAQANERMTKTLALMQQQRAIPEQQRGQWWQQNAPTISEIIGQDVSQMPVDVSKFSDQALDGQIAALSAQLGIAPEKPAGPDYQFLQGPDGAISRGDKTSGGLVQLQSGTPKPVEPKAPTVNAYGQMWDEASGQWVTIPGAMDNYSQMHPQRPEGSGSGLTPYQQIQVDRQAAADAAKQEETDRQKQINIASLKDGMSRVDQFLGSKGFEGLYGTSWLGPVPTMGNAKPENMMNQDELNSMAMLNQIGGEAFLAGVAKMRGTGPLSDNEGKRVMAAVQRLTDRRQDKASALAAAAEFKAAMDALVKVYEQESGGAAMPGAVQQPQAQPNLLDMAGQAAGNLVQGFTGMFGGGQRQGGQQPAPRPQPQQQSSVKPGTIDVDDDTGEQYRFKGGDPTDQRNWELVR